MKPVSADVMRRLDLAAASDFHIPSLLLMENAGRGVSELISREWKPCPVEIFAGKGNNGGDGLVAARHLTNRGFSVHVTLLADPERLKGDALTEAEYSPRNGEPYVRVEIVDAQMQTAWSQPFLLAPDWRP